MLIAYASIKGSDEFAVQSLRSAKIKFAQNCERFIIKDNHLANMALWLKSAGALNFEL